jgi:hypothetical protein
MNLHCYIQGQLCLSFTHILTHTRSLGLQHMRNGHLSSEPSVYLLQAVVTGLVSSDSSICRVTGCQYLKYLKYSGSPLPLMQILRYWVEIDCDRFIYSPLNVIELHHPVISFDSEHETQINWIILIVVSSF